jgi:Predicted Zn-dependent protease (DUF2268)
MAKNISKTIIANNKKLTLLAVSFSSEVPDYVEQIVKDAFEKLSPYITDDNQVLYIRDIPWLAIDGKYPGGNCHNRHEAMISVADWETEKQQIIGVVNHELHHMARWQNVGYGNTLGGAILSEGIATYYEELESGWKAPWSDAKLNNEILQNAISEWDSDKYNHQSWFFESEKGRWLGYGIGCRLAKRIFSDGFDLEKSLKISPAEIKGLLVDLDI